MTEFAFNRFRPFSATYNLDVPIAKSGITCFLCFSFTRSQDQSRGEQKASGNVTERTQDTCFHSLSFRFCSPSKRRSETGQRRLGALLMQSISVLFFDDDG